MVLKKIGVTPFAPFASILTNAPVKNDQVLHWKNYSRIFKYLTIHFAIFKNYELIRLAKDFYKYILYEFFTMVNLPIKIAHQKIDF